MITHQVITTERTVLACDGCLHYSRLTITGSVAEAVEAARASGWTVDGEAVTCPMPHADREVG